MHEIQALSFGPARDLYSPSAAFRGRRAYVEETCDRWFIISAKYGVVAPDQILDPYDVTLVEQSPAVKRQWAQKALAEPEERLAELEGMEFEIHAGRDYWGFGLADGLGDRGATVDIPTEGLSLGKQLAFYSHNEPRSAARKSGERMMSGGPTRRGSYEPLRAYLDQDKGTVVTLSFKDIERIVGRSLPASARNHRAWWANARTHTHARTWMDTGWKVDSVNLTAQRVTFRQDR